MPFELKILFVHAVIGGQPQDSYVIVHNKSFFTQTQAGHIQVL